MNLRAVLGYGALAVVVGGITLAIARPALVHSRYDSFVAAHRVGSSARELATAPFVASAELISVTDATSNRHVGYVAPHVAFPLTAGDTAMSSEATRQIAADLVEGAETFGWTGFPPFDRMLVDVRVRDGKILAITPRHVD